MHRYQTLLQLSLQTGTRVQKVDVSALATRRNCSFYLFEGLGINSQPEDRVRLERTIQFVSLARQGVAQARQEAALLAELRIMNDRIPR
jgi:hypothetical protein